MRGEGPPQFEAHLSSGCLLCTAKVRETKELLASIFQQIDKEKPDYHFVHATEGEWQEMAPGIVAKILSMDSTRQRVTP